jgi:hypothetical protein
MIFPMKKTTIALRREVLTISKAGDSMMVDVQFEFENPGKEQKLLVGFVTPPATGDVGSHIQYAYYDSTREYEEYEGMGSRAFVRDFSVRVNGEERKANAKLLGKSSFKLPNKKFAREYDFVYYFTATFKPGTNAIHHTYWMPMSGSVYEEFTGHYRLTTGTSWANKQIDDFTLHLFVPEPDTFYVTHTFAKNKKPAKWKIVGKGTLSTSQLSYIDGYHAAGDPITLVELQSGYLQLHVKDFKPEYDLVFGKERKYLE